MGRAKAAGFQIQSGDSASSVAAVQNLAVLPAVDGKENSSFHRCFTDQSTPRATLAR
ncbi:MAG: hypothetical protein HYY23_12745 [Verrucomicrobia bacterium]|nr:hypothetical protein [Verrucomicrobiota bacterium]